MKTTEQYDKIIKICSDIFEKKLKDYGAAWRILRPASLTDQIFIKINRIRSIQILGKSKVNEGVESEFIGIINYAIIAIIQLERGFSNRIDMSQTEAMKLYKDFFKKAKQLMLDKNHDYSEAWRMMRISSMTDLMLMKIFRIKQIEDNNGKTIISEGIDANHYDIINYAVFSLIKIIEENENHK